MDYWFKVSKDGEMYKYSLDNSGAYFFQSDRYSNDIIFEIILEISEREKYTLSKKFGGRSSGLYPYFGVKDDILEFTKEVLRRCEKKGAKVESNFYNSSKFYIDI